MKGTIKFFNKAKGYGFIKAKDNKEYFFHYSQFQGKDFKSLRKNDIVSFELAESDKNNRIQAINVKPVLTLSMIVHKLAKDKLCLMRIWDDKGKHGWYVIDELEHPVVNNEMDLLGLAAYVGIDTEGLLK